MRVHTLGRFLIEVDGEPLRFEAKAQRKPLELLKVLVAMGRDSVPTEPLIESLWPDSDGDRAHSAFTTTLARLRKLIGAAPVALQDGRLTLEPAHCWVDSREFVAALEAASQALTGQQAEAAWRHLESALALYRGPFLEGEFDPPEILSARERLHGQFLRHVEKLARFFQEQGDMSKAITLYQQGLDVDNLSEELYQHLMRCYLAQGRLVEGVAVYQRCRQIFRASVGIDPSAETEALHQALLMAQAQRAGAVPGDASAAVWPAVQPAAAPAKPLSASDPAHAAQRPSPAMATRPAVASERRTCTLIALRLVGYRTLAAQLDPEELETITSTVKADWLRILAHYGGTLNRFARDDALVLFGVPHAHEDDPVRAILAAGELKASLATRIAGTAAQSVRLSTGVHSGLVLAQPGPDGVGQEVSGGALDLALALCDQGPADAIVVSPETRRLIADFFDTAEGDPIAVPGREQALQTYVVRRPTGFRRRLEAAAQRGLTAFTGRDDELALLNACLAKALSGEGQLVTVVGDPGLGKSRLLHEFVAGLDRGAVNVVQCWAQSYGADTPYLPHQDGVRAGLGIADRAAPEERAAQAVQRVKAIDPALERYLPYLLNLLSLSDPAYPLPAGVTGEELRKGIHDALTALTIQSAARRPLVMIHEDWHWVDEPSLTALRAVVNMIAPHPLLIVVSYRPDYEIQWGHLSYHTPIPLRPLSAAHTRSVLVSLLGSDALPEGLTALVHERTGGNPFFIEEVCSALREEGALHVHDGQVALTRDLAALALPDTVQAVLRSRIDRLARDDQHTLRLASVIGRDFSRGLLARIASQELTLASSLERLRGSELIQQTQVVPDAQYRFRHVLTQVVAYETLLLQERRKLHGLVGEELEALYAGRLEEFSEALAYHYERSNDAERAIRYLRLAGDKAAGYFALEDARRHYRAALERLDALSAAPERKIERIEVSLQWASVSYFASTMEHLQGLERSRGYARELGDKALLARVTYWCGRINAVVGRTEQALREYEQALEQARVLGLDELETRALNSLGRLAVHTGRYAEGKAHLDAGMPRMLALGDQVEWVFSLHMLGRIQGTQGDFTQSYESLNTAIDRARALGNHTQESAARAHLGWMKSLQGDWPTAIACCDLAYAQAESIGNRLIISEAVVIKGYARFIMGARDEGLALIQRGLQLRATLGVIGVLTFNAYLVEVLTLVGRAEEAQRVADQLLELREQAGSHSGDIATQRALALLATVRTPPDWAAAERHAAQAIALSTERGARPDLALSRLRAAEVQVAKGDAMAATQYLGQAQEGFRTLGMTWWRAKAEHLGETLGRPASSGASAKPAPARARSRSAAKARRR